MLLLVDDDPELRSMLGMALSDEGYRVLGAGNAEAALYELSQHAVDLVLIDIRLPGMNGVELCREIRRRAKTPIVAVTAETGNGGARRRARRRCQIRRQTDRRAPAHGADSLTFAAQLTALRTTEQTKPFRSLNPRVQGSRPSGAHQKGCRRP